MTTLSILVVAHNEADQLADCLSQLQFADELVVILDKCTDNSKEIALEHHAKILEGSWELEGPRRNAGIEFCGSDWILEVDADERVPDTLAQEVLSTIKNPQGSYYLVPIDNYVGKRLVKDGWGGSFGTRSDLALFEKDAKRWGDQRVHPSLTLKGKEGGRLTTPITHYVDTDISDMWQRLDRYSTARALDYGDGYGKPGNLATNLRRLVSRFFKCYVRRGGHREGVYGVAIALCAGLFPLLSWIKWKVAHEQE